MEDKVEAQVSNNTWTLVPLPPGGKAVGSRWTFHIKCKVDGSIEHYKARWKGCSQQHG